ncbi:hypothetical protein [Fictibacillus norfolkensis]|uniref:hypothetical protein n=1 Tax=Fictibacillus norfolkensis TaxID=2762233 RepID=UPI00177F6F93|nr:hypothetical protein [Fictibacillus norfolkensis]
MDGFLLKYCMVLTLLCRLIEVEDARLLRDERSGGDSKWRKAAGGSPFAPWKASI